MMWATSVFHKAEGAQARLIAELGSIAMRIMFVLRKEEGAALMMSAQPNGSAI
jgi:hypothetical protein